MRKAGTVIFVALILAGLCGGNPTYGEPKDQAKEKPRLDVPYEPTTHGIAQAMLSMANVTSQDVVYDLGCGDGRIVIMAVKERGAKGIGVDLDPDRIKESKANARRAGVADRAQFFEQNLFATDIRNATVVMLYLWPQVNLKLRPKLLSELKPGTRVVSHSHTMDEWQADETRTVEKHDLHLFIIPANITGTWKWTDREGHAATLRLKQRFQKVEGSLDRDGRIRPVTNIVLRGDAVRFSVDSMKEGKETLLSFEGLVSGETITGSAIEGTGGSRTQWKATREPSTAVSIAE